MITSHADMGHTMHRLSNLAITVDGDTATARSYVDAILMAADGQTGLNPRRVLRRRTGAHAERVAHRPPSLHLRALRRHRCLRPREAVSRRPRRLGGKRSYCSIVRDRDPEGLQRPDLAKVGVAGANPAVGRMGLEQKVR